MQSDRSASSGKNLAKIVKKDLKSNEKITDLSFINNQEIIQFKKSPRKLPVNVQIALPNKIDLTKDLINEHEKQHKQTYGNTNKLKPLINQEKHYDLTTAINHHLNNETKITKEIPTHKYPFLHEDHVSIDQLKNKVYKSTLGVLPLRKSSQIEELNFIMRGQPLNKYKNETDIFEKTNRSNGDDDDDEDNDNDEEEEDESPYEEEEEEEEDDDRIDSEIGFYDKIHANLNTPVTSGMGDPLRSNTNRTQSPVQLNNNYRTTFDFRLREMSNLNPKFKPAILPITGTAGQAKFCQRPKPSKKNTTLTMQTRKKMQQKEQNENNLLNDGTRKETKSVADQQQFDLENQMKELVNEAKGIAGTTPKQQHSSSKKLKTDKLNVKRDDQLVSPTKVNERLLLSTVEGLISAIKSGQIIKEQEESNKHIHNILSTILDKESIIQFESVFDREKTVSTLTKESAKSKQDEASSLNVASDLDKMTNVGFLSNNNMQKEAFQSAVNLTSAGSKSLRNESSSLFLEESSKNTQRSIISYDEEINAYLASLPSEVTHTDVLNAYSKRVKLFEKEATVSLLRKEVQPVQQLTTEEKYAKNMHLFCMLEHEQRHSLLLPDELINITRKYHTKNKFESNMFYSGKSALSREPSMSSLKKSSSKQRVDTASMEEAAKRVLNNFPSTVNFDTSATPRSMNDSGFIDNSLESWRLQAETSLNKDFCLEAQKIELNNIELVTDPSLRYLRPAPPKMSIKPSEIRKNLYHDYVSMPPPVLDKVKSATTKSISSKKKKNAKDKLKQEPQNLIDDILTDEDTDTGSESYSTDSDSESIIQLDKILKRTYNSETNLSKKFKTITKNSSYFDGFKIKIKRTLSDTIVYDSIKREKNNSDYLNEFIQIDTSYTDALDEAMNQKLKIKENYINKKRLEELEKKSQLESKKETKSQITENEDFFPKAVYRDLVKEASDADRNYIIKDSEDTKKSKKSSKKQFKKLDSNLLNKIQNDMETKNRQNLKRSESLSRIKFPFVIRHPDDLIIRHPRTFLQKKRPSVPNLFDFEEYKNENQFDPDLGDREWTRKMWNIWFDEVIPQLDGTGGRPPSTLDNKKQQQQRREMNISMMSQTNASISVTTRHQQTVKTPDDDEEETGEANKDRKKETTKSPTPYDSYSTVQLYEDNVEPKESDLKDIKLFENEIDKLTKRIEIKETAFDLTRRGTLYRKLGYLSLALDDLTKALNLEPNFVDAFWQRHLIYLTQDKKNEAIIDLTILLKINRTHAGAYLSIADLYVEKKELYEALTNYTYAIKYDPNNYMAYFKRAKIYEIRGETRMSMDDYLTTTRLNPKFYDAWFCHGMNYYNNNNWHYAIVDFTELIANCPKNQSKARLYRGKCNLNLGEYQEALNDFGIAIHLNPMDWESYYHRGCLLRKINVSQALQDLSVSLLIENGYDNINAFLHRGIIYSETERFDEAIKDFESALDLDKEFAPAYCNLGIIYMNVHMNYWKAIKNFNNAIKSNHVYLRAYLCRAQAYRCIHDLKRAYIDYTKAIHLDPMNTQVYIYRGQVIYEMGNAKLASFCVQHAAFMNEGMNDNKPQQQTKSDTSATNRSKSAKTGGGQSKKKEEESAAATTANQSVTQQAVVFSFLKNFTKAISVLEHELKVKPNPEIYNLLGRVFMKAKRLNNAVTSFDESIECIMELIGVKDLKKNIQSYAKLNMPKEMHHYLTEALALKGQCFLDLANHQEAYNSFDKVIEMEPHNANAFFNRGMARFHLNHPKCIQDFNKALQIKPTLFEAFLARACVYGLKDRVTKAILNCNEAVKICPKSVRAYLYRGALKYLARSYSHAIYDLTKAIELDTTCAVAYFNRALCFQKLKKYNDSLKDYSIVLLLGEYLKYKVYINRGLLYFEIANYANSLKDFFLAADFDRANFRIQHMIGICLHKLGRYDESIEKLTGAYDTNSKFYDAIISRGNTHIDYGTREAFHKAQRDYELVLLKDPKNIDAHINLAYLFQMTGKYMKAWSQFSEALNINPNFVQIYEGRSIVCLQMSDTTAALKDINHAIKLKRSAEFYVNRGVIYQFMADNINAMRDYQAAILIDSNYGLAYYNSANILLIHRQYEQAVHMLNIAIDKCSMKDESTYQNRAISKAFIKDSAGAFKDLCEALKYDQYAAHIYMNRGLLLYKMENFKLAEKDLTTAISLSPNDALFYKIRADCLGKLEKKEEAIDDYKQFVDLNDRKEISNAFRQKRITK